MALASNKTIAKNSALLFGRTLISIAISLYTSRVVLQVLGVSDYGIYSVVGSVVATVSVLDTMLSMAISRFLTFEMGSGDKKKLHETYCTSLIGQVAIALFIVAILETLGIYLLNEKLVIDAERMRAAHIVFQLSIASSFISISKNVFVASISAHEDFNAYAYFDILGALFKLGIVFLLMVGSFDRLVFYGAMLFGVNVILFVIYWLFCRFRYEECKFEWLLNKEILVRMLKYSGWSMYGNVSKTLNIQGGNMILNIFFGTVVNAANGIAIAIQGMLVTFAYNIITAFRFQIVKSFAAREFEHMAQLIYRCGKYSMAMFLTVAIPLYIEMDYVLNLWLTEVPEYTSDFLRLLIIGTAIFLCCSIISISVGASEKVAKMNVINGTLYLAQLPLVYFLFKQGYSPNYLYVAIIPIYLFMLADNSRILRSLNPLFSFIRFLKNSYLDNSIPIVMTIVTGYALVYSLPSTFLRLVVVSASSVIIFVLYYYFFVFDKSQRDSIIKMVYSKLHITKGISKKV